MLRHAVPVRGLGQLALDSACQLGLGWSPRRCDVLGVGAAGVL